VKPFLRAETRRQMEKLLDDPKFVVTPDGQAMLEALAEDDRRRRAETRRWNRRAEA
jgi:hypothetical protein